MTTLELAKEFTGLLKANQHAEAGARFNADTVASYEAMEGPMAVLHGKDAVRGKGEWWAANNTVHGATVEGPYVNGDQFVVRFVMDVTPKESGVRTKMDEVGIYTVADGKIVEERFCYLQA